MTIKSQQTAAFKKASFKEFEDDMLVHIEQYFPGHYRSCEEQHLRETVRLAYAKGKVYGFISQRNVCMYLNNMLLLGSYFDTDPQYAWAHEILTNTKATVPNILIDRLSDEVLLYISRFSNFKSGRALLHLFAHKTDVFNEMMRGDLVDAPVYFSRLYPAKTSFTDHARLDEMVQLGRHRALKYGIKDESCVLVYVVLMFFMGGSFDTDPQFHWARNILRSANFSEREKVKHLFQTATNMLQTILFP